MSSLAFLGICQLLTETFLGIAGLSLAEPELELEMPKESWQTTFFSDFPAAGSSGTGIALPEPRSLG